MLNSIRKLYQKFVVENPDINISHTSFLRCKPFWVTRPRDSDRETCVCKQHDNLQYIQIKKIAKTANLQEIIELYTCDTENIVSACMGVVKNVLISGYNWKEWKGQKQCLGLNGRTEKE